MESPAPWNAFTFLGSVPRAATESPKRPPALPRHPRPGDSEEAEGRTAWHGTAIEGPWEVPVLNRLGSLSSSTPQVKVEGGELSPPRVPSAGASIHTLQRRPRPGSGGHTTTLERRTVRAALGGPSDRPSCDRSNECALVTPFDLGVPGLRSELVTPHGRVRHIEPHEQVGRVRPA